MYTVFELIYYKEFIFLVTFDKMKAFTQNLKKLERKFWKNNMK